jgi:hypothetical protein
VQQTQASVKQLLLLVVQLGFLILVIRQFQIETAAFFHVILLTSAGFVAHTFLPFPYRLPFFVCLSLAGIGLVFGLVESFWLIALGLILIGVCHLPLRLTARVCLLLTVGGSLALLRVGWAQTPWSAAVWPILASMFMFRLVVYLYDIEHDTAPVSPWRTLAYFFLLPNVCFPLFPVVDYKTFRRTYYDESASLIYQKGIAWMARGVFHLILYRLVYYYWTMPPSEVESAGKLLQFIISNYLLYLRISGLFHLAIGMLLLFGFHLPETHHLYYLASSFTDYWRRINIYWKDFMLKLFYYPAYFKLRRWGNTTALVGATIVVFVSTWFMHAYQWFWLRGSFLFSWPDILFWALFALLVVMNSLYEATATRGRTLGGTAWSLRSFPLLSLQKAGTFLTICILWSLWTSESVSAWLSLWSSVGKVSTAELTPLGLLLVGAIVLGSNSPGASGSVSEVGPQKHGFSAVNKEKQMLQKDREFYRSVGKTLTLLIVVALFSVPVVYSRLGPQVASFVVSLKSRQLNRVDMASLERGYYEELLNVNRFNSQLWEVYANRPLGWLEVHGIGLERFTGDFLQRELIPSSTTLARGIVASTNRWGMRDKEYEQILPPGTYRIALLGSSTTMGWGVNDGETYESLVESKLNNGNQSTKYEILNFAVGGYKSLQQRAVLEKALNLHPHALFYVATEREAFWAAAYLADIVRKKVEISYPYLVETVKKAELRSDQEEEEMLRRLAPFENELIAWLYREISDACRRQAILPVWIFLPHHQLDRWQQDKAGMRKLAEEAGFQTLDLSSVFENRDFSSFRLADWDNHPNAKGHELIASHLYKILQEKMAEGMFSPSTQAAHDTATAEVREK